MRREGGQDVVRQAVLITELASYVLGDVVTSEFHRFRDARADVDGGHENDRLLADRLLLVVAITLLAVVRHAIVFGQRVVSGGLRDAGRCSLNDASH